MRHETVTSICNAIYGGARAAVCSCLIGNRRSQFSALTLIAAVLLFSPIAQAAPGSVDRGSGEFIIKFSRSVGPARRATHRQRLRVRAVRDLRLIDAQVVKASSHNDFDHEYAKELLAQGQVEFAEPNYTVRTTATPNDFRYSSLWGLHNVAQEGGTSDIDINAPEAWDIRSNTNDVVVGVIDTGVNYNHPDLAANMWINPGEIPGNDIDDDGNGFIDDVYGYNAIDNSGDPNDDNGHGSHVAGTIGAEGNNSIGVTGVAWRTKIMALKFLGSEGEGTVADGVKAIEYAVEMRKRGVNIRVLNNSWGGPYPSQALEEAVQKAYANGILFVASAGNDARDNDSIHSFPANISLPNVVSVAAVDRNGNLATFSNFGLNTVHLAAPGVSILSTVLGTEYQQFSGTSMSAPFVSGVAALVAANEPALTVDQLKGRLLNTVKFLPTLNGLIQKPGIVDAHAALTNRATPEPPADQPRYYRSASPLGWENDLGTRVLQSDDGYVEASLPFAFPFYRKDFHRIAISANGRIQMLAEGEDLPTYADYANRPLPGISVYHDDLYPSNDIRGGVWIKSESHRVTVSWVVVPYSQRSHQKPSSLMAFQAMLYPNGKVSLVYLDTNTGEPVFSMGASATVGVLPPYGLNGERLTVTHNVASSEVQSGRQIELSPNPIATRGTPGLFDFDGDKKSDLVVYRPSAGHWYILTSSSQYNPDQSLAIRFGGSRDLPMIADFDGDGLSDIVIWRPSRRTFYYRTSSSGWRQQSQIVWAHRSGERPIIGDFDGDARSDIAFYHPRTGLYRTHLSSKARAAARGRRQVPEHRVRIQTRSAAPLVADFAGRGRSSFVAVDSSTRVWTAKGTDNRNIMRAIWGVRGDLSLACDWDGNGVADKIVVRPSSDRSSYYWFVMTDSHVGTAIEFGQGGATPQCSSDFDGDGRADLHSYDRHTGRWLIRSSVDDAEREIYWGAPGDIPLN